MQQQIKKQVCKNIKICKYCNEIQTSSHHCSGRKAFEKGIRTVILNLDKLMYWDEIEDDMVIERIIWEDFRRLFMVEKVFNKTNNYNSSK